MMSRDRLAAFMAHVKAATGNAPAAPVERTPLRFDEPGQPRGNLYCWCYLSSAGDGVYGNSRTGDQWMWNAAGDHLDDEARQRLRRVSRYAAGQRRRLEDDKRDFMARKDHREVKA